jgi:hypothetical protein
MDWDKVGLAKQVTDSLGGCQENGSTELTTSVLVAFAD